ncbi:hypothetical protein LRS10_12010 [Phenylobacterium sp. J426]|uniref:hypothetical protein n=1 Tax=Phenylobacterium sp. J426 TaxID=2898439 RepID=UPI002151C9F5|nr:hypothetical protein [Phenylobacterium sp. J426]MCR5874831.1 hypothetical protein [Phenylobacterium sp. J426]
MDVARGAAALLFALTGAVAVLGFARRATGAGAGYFDQSYLLAQAGRWETAVLLLGLGFLILAAATAARGRWLIAALPLAAGLGAFALDRSDRVSLIAGMAAGLVGLFAYWKPAGRPGAWAGVLILSGVIAMALQALAPTIAYVAAWPLLLGAIGAAATDMGVRRGAPAFALLALLAAVGLAFAGGYAHTAYLSLDVMALQALPILMAALVLWPLAQPVEGAPPARLLGPLLLLAGAGVTLWVRFDEPWSARHPQLSYVQYHVDQDAGRAWRVSQTSTDGGWTRTVLAADGGTISETRHWMAPQPYRAAPAAMVQESPPEITFAPQGEGRFSLRAVPPPGARILSLQLRPSVDLPLEGLGPKPLVLRAGKWNRIWWEAEPAGVAVAFRAPPGAALDLRYAATLERWPAAAKPLPLRPTHIAPFHTSDSTIVTGSRRFTW